MVVLGISVSTRLVGFAVMKDKELIEYRTKVFGGTWNKEKHLNILAMFDMLYAYYNVTHLAIKTVHPSHSNKALNALTEQIVSSAQKEKISVEHYSLSDLKNHLNLNKKQGVMGFVADKHLELQNEYQKECNSPNSYYIKMFEAIAVAEIQTKQ
jgi:hypothetical protein